MRVQQPRVYHNAVSKGPCSEATRYFIMILVRRHPLSHELGVSFQPDSRHRCRPGSLLGPALLTPVVRSYYVVDCVSTPEDFCGRFR